MCNAPKARSPIYGCYYDGAIVELILAGYYHLDMDWGTLVTSYIAIAGIVISLGTLCHQLFKEEFQQPIGDWLDTRVKRKPEDWARSVNRAFLHIFDRLYGGQKTTFARLMWKGLILPPVLLICIKTAHFTSEFAIGRELFKLPGTVDLLLLAMGLALVILLVELLSQVLGSGSTSDSDSSQFSLWGCLPFMSVYILVIIIGGVVAIHEIQDKGFLDYLQFWEPDTRWLGLKLTIFSAPTIIVGVVGAGLVGFIGASGLPIHPLKALVSSIFFMGIVGLFQRDAAMSFFKAIAEGDLKLFAFVGFNIFADGISLAETWWVLRYSSTTKFVFIPFLLLLDVLISATIYLILPIMLGEIEAFKAAVFFSGDRPWLGILFWSTFSTSVVFYLFVASALLVRPLSHIPQFGRHLDVQTKPVLTLTFVATLVVTFTFWATVGGTMIFNTLSHHTVA